MYFVIYFSFSQQLQVIIFLSCYVFSPSNGKWNKYNQNNYFESENKQVRAVGFFKYTESVQASSRNCKRKEKVVL